jgi:hypothetical protein
MDRKAFFIILAGLVLMLIGNLLQFMALMSR